MDKLVDKQIIVFFSTIYVIFRISCGGRINMNFSKLNNLWSNVLLSLKNKLQDNNIFNTFFQDSKLYEVKDDMAYISHRTDPAVYLCR